MTPHKRDPDAPLWGHPLPRLWRMVTLAELPPGLLVDIDYVHNITFIATEFWDTLADREKRELLKTHFPVRAH